jgi:hypothetical protein
MNDINQMNDTDSFDFMYDAVSRTPISDRPSLEAIVARGQARRRRRLSGLGVGVAASIALALGLTSTLGAAPGRGTVVTHAAAPAPTGTKTSTRTVQTAAFILASNANGTDTLTLTMSQVLDPTTLQQALTQHGIPDLVEAGTFCTSVPAAPDPASIGVLSVRLAAAPHKMVPAPSGPVPSQVTQMAARTVTVIDPAAIPTGTELFFGYSRNLHAVFTDLIYTRSYTCSSNPATTG